MDSRGKTKLGIKEKPKDYILPEKSQQTQKLFINLMNFNQLLNANAKITTQTFTNQIRSGLYSFDQNNLNAQKLSLLQNQVQKRLSEGHNGNMIGNTDNATQIKTSTNESKSQPRAVNSKKTKPTASKTFEQQQSKAKQPLIQEIIQKIQVQDGNKCSIESKQSVKMQAQHSTQKVANQIPTQVKQQQYQIEQNRNPIQQQKMHNDQPDYMSFI